MQQKIILTGNLHQELMKKNIIEMAKSISVLSKLSEDDIEKISDYLQVVEVNKGATVFAEGGPGEYACFVVDGILDITKKTLTGSEISIATLSNGDSMGEMSLVDNLNRSATVKARTNSILLMLTKDKFDELISDSPYIGIEILQGIAKTLSLHLRRTIDNLSFES